MDVERTIQFILDHQAAAEVEMGEIRAAVQENTTQIKILTAQQAKTNRRLDAFSKIVQTGMKLLVRMERDTNKKIGLLTEAQLRAERKVDRLIDSFRASRNGGSHR